MRVNLRAVRVLGVYADRMEVRCTEQTDYDEMIGVEASYDTVSSVVSSVTLDRAGVKIVIGYKGVVPEVDDTAPDRLYDISMNLVETDAAQMRYVYRIRKMTARKIERCDADEPSPDADDVKTIVEGLLNEADIALRDLKRVYVRHGSSLNLESLSELVESLKTCASAA